MKKTTLSWPGYAVLAIVLCAVNFSVRAQQVVRCYTDEQHAIRRAQTPGLESDEQFEQWISQAKAEMAANKIIGGVYQIPVVVHVIHSGEAVGSGTNVSQAAIQSQIDVLNEDFRRMLGSNGYNTSPVGADTEIEFCLAQRRPDGSAFTAGQPGVNRILYSTITATAPPYSTTFIDATIKTWTYNGGVATATRGWDPNKYMNIWLCNISGGILGYAQFPQSPLGGMFDCASGGAAATDGVVFLYSSIGKSSVTGFPGPYNEGRTATHEVAHWLGLRHIWGDGGCTVDDYCNDTPEASTANYGCPIGVNSCTAAPDAGIDMVENYMDYTDDACMNIFTNDQKQRMRAVLEGSPMRLSLINSDACTPPNTNDASVTDVFNPKGDHCAGSIIPSVQLRNRGSGALTSATISYTVDNGAVTTFSWTGSLAAGASATVALPAFTTTLGVHTFRAYSTLPNAAADPSTLYDTSGISFVVSSGIMPNYGEDFEAENFPPDQRWVVENVNSDCREWTAASGTSAAGTFVNNTAMLPFYNNSSTSSENLYTPIFILPCNATAASLTFNVAYRQRTGTTNDRLLVEISQDCGVTWAATTYDKQGSTLAVSATLTGAAEYYPTAASHWRTETINLLSYVTTTSKNIRFRFRGIANNGNNIFVDDIQYTATIPGEASVVQNGTEILDGGAYSFGSVTVNTTSAVTFTLQNTGTSNLTVTPPATVTGTGFALTSTFGATTIPAGGSTTFTLGFTPNATGAFSGNVSFTTNDCDEGTYNFALSGTGFASAPVADFSAVPVTVCTGSPVTFTNLSTNAASYAWTFPASAVPASSAAVNPTVIFGTAGTYAVTLVATNTFGTDTETKTAYITVISGTGNALPITEGFTAATFPPTGWSVVNPDGSATWARSTAAGNMPTTGNSMLFNNYSISDVGNQDEVWVKPANLQGMSAAQLTFDVAYAPYNVYASDGLQVLVSTDCGATFTNVYYKAGTTLATATATTSQFTPTAGQWRTETVSLNSYINEGNVIVAFRNMAGAGNRLFVDNINITGTAVAAAPTPTFTASPTAVCAGSTVTYTNTTSGATAFSWSFPGGTPATSTAENPVVTYAAAGTYNVSLTASNGSGSNTATQNNYITVHAIPAAPTITAGGPVALCTGGSVTLTSSAASGNTWSGGQITQAITVSAAGTYSVTTTTNGCTSPAAAPVTVTVSAALPTPTITAGGPTTFCTGGSVTLTSSSASGNTWSNGATTQSITVSAGGTYTVTVTSGSCSATSAGTTITVMPLPATPTITAGGPTTFCAGGSVTLTSSSASGNTWSNGATTQSITVSTAGTYTVSVTNGGCTSMTSAGTTVTVTPLPATPTITAGGPTTFCAGGSVTLTSSSASGNTWSNGATTQSITVSSAGTYTVSVTSGGCTSAPSAGTTITVTPLPATPTITAGGPTTFCAGGSVTLTSSSASGNNWSNGATTQSITVSTAGTYAVSVTSGGCTSATSAGTTITVTSLPATPTITAGGPTTFCAGGSVTLTSSSASGNSWSNGTTTQSITVSTAGTYTVSVTSGGCTSATSAGTAITVTPLPATPTITAGGPTTFCAGGSVTLTSSSASGNTWSSGATTQSITVSTAGTYAVSVTSGGCTSATSAGTTITVTPLPATPTITAGGPTTFCAGGSVTLTSSSASGNTWSNGATTQSITVSTAGTYTVSVTNGGCTSMTSAGTTITVTPLPATPTITAGGPTTFCAGGSVTLTSSSASGNTWSNGATTQSITVSSAGTYTVSVTSGGCTSTTSAGTTVTVNPAPVIALGTVVNPTSCASATGSIQVTGSGTGNLSWSGTASGSLPAVTLPATIPGLTAGSYVITFSSASGCLSNTLSQGLNDPSAPATPTITASGTTTFCEGNNVVLTSSSATGNTWSNGAATQSITVTSSGSYAVTVTNVSGCSATSAATAVTVNTNPLMMPGTVTDPIACGTATGSIQLTGSGTGDLSWTGTTSGTLTGTTLPVTVPGLAAGAYSFTLTNAAGCTSGMVSQGLSDPSAPATPVITTTDATTFCAGGSATLISSSATGNTWSTGETTQTIVVSTAGNYAVTFTDGGGCSSTSAATAIVVLPAPTATFATIADLCIYDAPVTLTQGSPAGGQYSGNGVIGGQFDPAAAGLGTSTLSYVYQDANGCMDTATATVTVDGCAGIAENAALNIHVFPNPSAGLFTIDAGTALIGEVAVYDNAGRLVQMLPGLNAATMEVNLARMSDGMYTLRILTEAGAARIPVVVNK